MNQQPKDNPSLTQESKAIGGLAVYCVYCSIQPVRLFSRIPGTMGPGAYLPLPILIGWAETLFVATLILPADGTAPFWFCQIGSWLVMIHLLAWLHSHIRGNGYHTHYVGETWFASSNATLRPGQVGARGDAITAFILAAIALGLGAPSLAIWFLINIPLAYAAYGIIGFRDLLRQANVSSSRVDIDYWEEMVTRAEHESEDLE